MAARPASATPARWRTPIADAIEDNNLVAVAVLSGNRNFEGRVHPNVRANYLASPPLVVAYALLGKMTEDITTVPLGTGHDGKPVYLRDVWPTNAEIAEAVRANVNREQFVSRYAEVFKGPKQWQAIDVEGSDTYRWSDGSTYVKNPPYFEGITMEPAPVTDIKGARMLAVLGDSITTDHISPAGSIRKTSPAGDYLLERQVTQKRTSTAMARRRGNHEVMMRGTFANHPHPQRDGAGHRGRGSPATCPRASRCRSMTRRCATRRKACRWWCSPARNTAPVRRATGRRRARSCSASGR